MSDVAGDPSASNGTASSGTVEHIFLAPTGTAEPTAVDEAEVEAGKGLRGDRYANGTGTFSSSIKPGRHVTLIESEAIEAVRREHGLDVSASDPRRNVVTSGVRLNDLVGVRFSVGDVVLQGIRLCEPCDHLERISGIEGLKKAFVHRAGLRTEIVRGGRIRVGDQIARVADSVATDLNA
jgi:MOSC domain-containing protein YiiM